MRRYKIGLNPYYDSCYDVSEGKSDILHPSPIANVHTLFRDRRNLIGSKNELIEVISLLEDKLTQLNKRFESWQVQLRKEGKEVPEQMTGPQEKEKFMAESLCDVRQEELEYIEGLIDAYVEEEDKSSDALVLCRGPIGSAQLRGGAIFMIDGMKCSVNEDGIPYISDERSPYCGMSTAAYYRDIVTPYQKARRKNQEEIEKQIREKKLIREDVPKGKLSGSAPWPEIPAGTKLYKTI